MKGVCSIPKKASYIVITAIRVLAETAEGNCVGLNLTAVFVLPFKHVEQSGGLWFHGKHRRGNGRLWIAVFLDNERMGCDGFNTLIANRYRIKQPLARQQSCYVYGAMNAVFLRRVD